MCTARRNLDIDRKRNVVIPRLVQSKLQALEEDACSFIEAARKHGTVIMVTNAAEGWLEKSAMLTMPGVWRLLKQRGIQVVYARTVSQSRDPGHWKIAAFGELVQEHRELLHGVGAAAAPPPPGSPASAAITATPINLVSVGDGLYEQIAARAVASEHVRSHHQHKTACFVCLRHSGCSFLCLLCSVLRVHGNRLLPRVCPRPLTNLALGSQDVVKTVKFVDEPTIEQLQRQLRMTQAMLPELAKADSQSVSLRTLLLNPISTTSSPSVPSSARRISPGRSAAGKAGRIAAGTALTARGARGKVSAVPVSARGSAVQRVPPDHPSSSTRRIIRL